MEALLKYLLTTSICLTLAYLIYLLFFRKETNFKQRRYFLLFATIFSLLFPLGNFYILLPQKVTPKIEQVAPITSPVVTQELSEYKPVQSNTPATQFLTPAKITKKAPIKWTKILQITYFSVLAALLLRILVQLAVILVWYTKSEKIQKSLFTLVFHSRFSNPFSFFKWIFLTNKKLPTEDFKKILAHETVHVQQKHSIDTVIFELLCAIMWFNPFAWMMRSSLHLTHEFLADEGAIDTGINSTEYQALMINQVAEMELIGITSHFSKSMLSRRIQMITNNKLYKKTKYKILFLIPVAAILFLFIGGINGFDQRKVLYRNMKNDPVINTVFTKQEIKDLADFRYLFDRMVENATTNATNRNIYEEFVKQNAEKSITELHSLMQVPHDSIVNMILASNTLSEFWVIRSSYNRDDYIDQMVPIGKSMQFIKALTEIDSVYSDAAEAYEIAGDLSPSLCHKLISNPEKYQLQTEAGKLFISFLFTYALNPPRTEEEKAMKIRPPSIKYVKVDTTLLRKRFQSYQKNPSEKNAKKLYEALPENGYTRLKDTGQKIINEIGNNLSILEKQVSEEKVNSIKVAFRMFGIADGAFTEWLQIMLGNLITNNPELFLTELKAHQYIFVSNKYPIHNLGPEFADKFDLQKQEIEKRIEALESVTNPELEILKERCIKQLEKRAIELKSAQPDTGLPIDDNHTGYLDIISVETLFKKLHINAHNDENSTILSYSVKHTPNAAQWGVYIPKWLNYHDLEFLVSQLDSEEKSKILVSTYSSNRPFGLKNEIKNFAALFLELYRNDAYLSGLVVDPDYSTDAIQELKDWWEQNKKHIEELKHRPIKAAHNYSIYFIREILRKEELTKDQEFEEFVKDCDFSASLDMTRDQTGNQKQGWSIRSHEGIFGSDYHRIDFFINDVKKSTQNPRNYLVKGKSRLKDNICDFEGEINITDIRKHNTSSKENPRGVIVASYSFREDKSQYGSGEFNGYFSSGIIGKDNLGSWDEIRETDLYGTFVGTWKGYKTGTTKKCIWKYYTHNYPFSEDFHEIPESEIVARNKEIEKIETPLSADELFGKGINPKYKKNGWDKNPNDYNRDWWQNTETNQAIRKVNLEDINIQTLFAHLRFKPSINFIPDKDEMPFLTYVTVNGTDFSRTELNVREWLSYEDLEFLMTNLESEQVCKNLVSSFSSYLPFKEKSTIGGFAALFLNYYRNNQIFRPLVSTPTVNAEMVDELKEWWDTYKHETIRSYKTGDIEIKTNQLKNNNASNINFLCRGKIVSYKNNIATDSLIFDDMEAVGDRYGFNFSTQPVPGIIIGSKFGDYNGRMLIIDESGKIQNYSGGFFLITRNRDQQYLISPWHSDLAGITVYNLKNNELLMEKQTNIYPANWYYFEGDYYISEWKNNKETDNIYRLDIHKGELIKSTKTLDEIQKGELLEFFNTEFCNCD